MTPEQIEHHVKFLNCHKNVFYDADNPRPEVGKEDVLYVDNETGIIYIWDGSEYITADVEQRICLNTATPAFAPLDNNNPTTAEVEAYVNTNLSPLQLTNGTQIVYFVGDGGSCDNPDFIWTLNNNEITLSNKRVFNTKTIYVDAGSGSDVTGRSGYREFPFQTLNAAIAATQTGDLLKVFPGTYTQTTTIQNLINIDCDNGVDWTFTGNFFNNTPDSLLDVTTTWNFDVLRSTLTTTGTTIHNLGIKNSLGTFILNANKLEYVYHTANNAIKQRSINVKKLISSYIVASSLSPTVDGVAEINLDYYERTITNNSALLIGAQMSDNSKLITRIKNLKSINSRSGYGNTPTIGYYFSSDSGINKQYITIIDNVTHDDPNIYVTPPTALSSHAAWGVTPSTSGSGQLIYLQSGLRSGSIYNFEINNLKLNGSGISYSNASIVADKLTLNIKIKGTSLKGIPIYLWNNIYTNSIINIDIDMVCETSPGIVFDNSVTASTNVINITGKIVSKYAGMPCITILAPTNNTINLKDLILINDGTVSPIMTSQVTPQNVQIQNVVTNSLVVDPNITEVGQLIIRNANNNF